MSKLSVWYPTLFSLQCKNLILTQLIRALKKASISYLIFSPCLKVYLLIQCIFRMILISEVLVLWEHSFTFLSLVFRIMQICFLGHICLLLSFIFEKPLFYRSWWLSDIWVTGLSGFCWFLSFPTSERFWLAVCPCVQRGAESHALLLQCI